MQFKIFKSPLFSQGVLGLTNTFLETILKSNFKTGSSLFLMESGS